MGPDKDSVIRWKRRERNNKRIRIYKTDDAQCSCSPTAD